jgi:hypothetical protein
LKADVAVKKGKALLSNRYRSNLALALIAAFVIVARKAFSRLFTWLAI